MIVRSQFQDLVLEDALPALNAVTMDEFSRYPPQYPQIFKVESSERAIEQFTQVTGFGTMTEIAEGEPITFDEPLQGYDKTYRHRKFGKGYKASQEMMDDDKYRVVKRLAMNLGKSANETREIEAALIFNRGFNSSYLGPDGKVLFATDHPRVGGGTQSNRPTVAVDLDIPSLEAGLTTFGGWTDDRGKLILMRPATLVVHRSNAFNASEILGSALRSDTANNANNAFKDKRTGMGLSDYFVWQYLTDEDAWFLITDPSDPNYEIRFFDRKKFALDTFPDPETDSHKTMGRYRMSVGWNDWRGVYGSPGA